RQGGEREFGRGALLDERMAHQRWHYAARRPLPPRSWWQGSELVGSTPGRWRRWPHPRPRTSKLRHLPRSAGTVINAGIPAAGVASGRKLRAMIDRADFFAAKL